MMRPIRLFRRVLGCLFWLLALFLLISFLLVWWLGYTLG
jgi:hypothetical protein